MHSQAWKSSGTYPTIKYKDIRKYHKRTAIDVLVKQFYKLSAENRHHFHWKLTEKKTIVHMCLIKRDSTLQRLKLPSSHSIVISLA